ncbi:MAG: mediator of RNA polymerase II transcription subunit 17 [Chloroflexota bacterium]|nr:mediator of RNA polymerase II transcription subunit 17 [Chloroflexota bacterium]
MAVVRYTIPVMSGTKDEVLTDDFLQRALARACDERTVGVMLRGSFVRGRGHALSDVDLDVFVPQEPGEGRDRYTLFLQDERLVSVTRMTIAAERETLSSPERAIWNVPGIRQARILFDRDSSLAALQREAEAFRWETLQDQADQYAAYELMGCAEEAHKILAGLRDNRESAVAYATIGLSLALTRAIAVQRGILIESENHYFEDVQASMKDAGAWPSCFRAAMGLEVSQGSDPAYRSRGIAALDLYRETARLFDPILQGENRAIVSATVRRMATIISHHRPRYDANQSHPIDSRC